MPISIDFLANVRDVLRGGDQLEATFDDVADSLDALARDGRKSGEAVGKSLDTAADSLDDLGDESRRAGEKLGDELKDGAREGERAVDKLEASFREMADASRAQSRSAGDSVGSNIRRGTQEAEGGLKDLKEESASTAKESAASFDGSAESIVDAFQEVAANAFIGFGPAGLVAGLAAAAGIGLISAAIADGTAEGEELKQKIADVTAELIESGENGAPSIEYLESKIRELATATEGVTLKELAKTAQDSGADFRDLAQAYAGNTDQLKDLWRESQRRLEQMQEEADATDTSTSAGTRRYSSLMNQISAQERYTGFLGQSIGVAKEAAEAEQNYAAAGGPELAAKAQALGEYADEVQDALTGAGEAWEQYTHDGIVNLDEYNAAIEAQAAAIAGYQANVVTATQTLSQEALNYIMSMGPAAAPLLQAYIDAPLEQKERTAANWATLGTAAADNYTSTLKAGIPGQIDGPTITARPDFSAWEEGIRQFQQRDYTVGVGVRLIPGQVIN